MTVWPSDHIIIEEQEGYFTQLAERAAAELAMPAR